MAGAIHFLGNFFMKEGGGGLVERGWLAFYRGGQWDRWYGSYFCGGGKGLHTFCITLHN